jgi:hypothetical protein
VAVTDSKENDLNDSTKKSLTPQGITAIFNPEWLRLGITRFFGYVTVLSKINRKISKQ